MDKQSRENFIIHLMNTGFGGAADSFSKIVRRKVQINHSPSILVDNPKNISYSTRRGQLSVLTTHVIGDISGKSYLIFNQEETEEIFKVLETSVINNELKDAFLMEIDNIISALVIAELANALRVEVYGDVPQITKISSDDLAEFMKKELTSPQDSSNVILCSTSFKFENHEKINPHFIWKLNNRVFDLIPAQKITA